jgi:hypothetical protein
MLSKNKDLSDIVKFLSNRILSNCVNEVSLLPGDSTYKENIYVVVIKNYLHQSHTHNGLVVKYESDGKVNEFISKEYYDTIKKYLGKSHNILLSGVNTTTSELELIY